MGLKLMIGWKRQMAMVKWVWNVICRHGRNLPQRYKLIGTASLAFVVCNMDKVNLSVAIIPMSHQFGWNASVAGLVQSSFFWGCALSQLPGGWLAKIFGGRKILQVGVLVWSLATSFVPILAGFMPGLIPEFCLLFAPPLIKNYGSEFVFYIFGILGVACLFKKIKLHLTQLLYHGHNLTIGASHGIRLWKS